jgi:hypothetical protein
MTISESKFPEFIEERPRKKHLETIDTLDLAQTENDFYVITLARDPCIELRFLRK